MAQGPHPAIRVTLNGDVREIPDGSTIGELVRELRLEGRPVAVERNREVVPQARFSRVTLRDGDRIEFVPLVGGS